MALPNPASLTSLESRGAPAPQLETVGEWILLREVARGTWTSLFQARARSTSSSGPPQYAVKVLRLECEQSQLAQRFLRREVDVARSVSHPHIVPVLAWQLRQPRRYVVTPWLEGCPLRVLIERHAPLPLADALWLARQTSQALAALHDAGWIHSDLKPENIIVNLEYHVTLIDLGLCTSYREVECRKEVLAGTPNYMAPEWFLLGYRPDFRADLFSLGIILLEMLCGRRLYTAKNFEELIAVHRSWKLTHPRTLIPAIPNEVAALLQSLLARVPQRRPESAHAVAETLQRLEIEFFGNRQFFPQRGRPTFRTL